MLSLLLALSTFPAAMAQDLPLETAGAERGDLPGLTDRGDDDGEAVTGGAQTAHGAWPDAAGVVFGYNDVGCTGVLVAPTVVLTAAHCIGGISKVVLNSNDWAADQDGILVNVIHEYAYANDWSTSHDIGLLILERPVTEIAPRVIARDCVVDDYLAAGAPVAIVGFGTVDQWGDVSTTELREGFTTVTDPDCTNGRGCIPQVSPGGELGAGGGGVDACFGDSGGPLYLQTEEGDFLVGLTSRAYDDVAYPCGLGGIYSRPDSVIDWIEQRAGITLPRPVCNLPPQVDSLDTRKVPNGRTERVRFHIGSDPEGDSVSLRIAQAPALGTVELDGDVIVYTAPMDYVGRDDLAVEVLDDGAYPYALPVIKNVPIEVVHRGVRPWRACGCDQSQPAGGGVAVVALAWLLARRRRASR